MFYKVEEVIEHIKTHEIQYVNFHCYDIATKRLTVTMSAQHVTPRVLTTGIPLDTYNAGKRFIFTTERTDLIMKPDVTTTCVDIYCAYPALSITCDMRCSEGDFSLDPRTTMKKVTEFMKKNNIADFIQVQTKIEFCIYDSIRYGAGIRDGFFNIKSDEGSDACREKREYGNGGHRPTNNGGIYSSQPIDTLFDLRTEITENMRKTGLNPMTHYHEIAMGQGAVLLAPTDFPNICDVIDKARYIIKGTAASYGKTATFMPKTMRSIAGIGMPTAISLWKNGENLMTGDVKYNLSETALHFIGGILKNIDALMAFTNASGNSYDRLADESPNELGYSPDHRSDAIYIPHFFDKYNTQILCRFVDASMNPYLGLAAIMAAGLNGIVNRVSPDMPRRPLPRSFSESINALKNNHDFLKGIFSDELIEHYIWLKSKEIASMEGIPHPIEFFHTFSC